MANLKEIKTRIGSVKNTQKITKAMKMISVVRLRSAQNKILNLRAYARSLEEVLADICLSQQVSHRFLNQKSNKDLKNVLTILVTSDRGLCGGFNGNICRFAEKSFKESSYKKQDFLFIGEKGADYFRFRGMKGQEIISNLVKEISYPFSVKITKDLMAKMTSKNYDGVFIIYNEFKSVASPRIVCERILPFDLESEALAEKKKDKSLKNIIFEVKPKDLIEDLLERYFSIHLYRCLCESIASEHGARMVAMENATSNAEDVVTQLTLSFNKLRQSAITTELTEIVSGVESLKQ